MDIKLAKVFKSLGDETRIAIVNFLIGKKELSCQEISKHFKLSQPTLSHHFNKLVDASIVKIKKVGTGNFYTINKKFLAQLSSNIEKVALSK